MYKHEVILSSQLASGQPNEIDEVKAKIVIMIRHDGKCRYRFHLFPLFIIKKKEEKIHANSRYRNDEERKPAIKRYSKKKKILFNVVVHRTDAADIQLDLVKASC